MIDEFDPLVGRTVTAVESSEYGDRVLLHLDDGTFLRVVAHGYDDVGLSAIPLTAEDIERERKEAEEEERRLKELAAIAAEKLRVRVEEWEKNRAYVEEHADPEAYAIWLKDHPRPGTVTEASAILKDLYVEPIREALNRQTFLLGGDR